MKMLLSLLAAVLAGAGAGYVAATLASDGERATVDAAAPELDAASAAAVERLARQVDEQARTLDELRMELAARAPTRLSAASSPGPAGSPDSAVLEAPAQASAAAGAAPADFDIDEALSSISLEHLDWNEREELFNRARKAGKLDELIAQMEEWAAERPEDPEAQVALASAYVAKIRDVGQSPEAGKLAMKADGAYDRALAVDDHHWEARFAKAMSLSFWPPVFGKQTEAIKHFEILAQQQAGLPAQDHFAQTYLMLGNTYQQVGQLDKALAAWQKGLQVFPGNAELAKQIELAKSAQGNH